MTQDDFYKVQRFYENFTTSNVYYIFKTLFYLIKLSSKCLPPSPTLLSLRGPIVVVVEVKEPFLGVPKVYDNSMCVFGVQRVR